MSALEVITCGECGIQWGMPPRFVEARREDGKGFYCPNGHCQAFTDSTADKLRRERDQLRQDQARLHQRLAEARDERDAERRRVSAAKGQITRLKNRAAAGVCPCCNRTFVNLARHMAGQHKGFVAEEINLDGAVVH